jgi:hypothetical protein
LKRFFTLLLLILAVYTAGAQNRRLTVRSFSRADIGDMRARTSPVLDNNGKLTALVDITFAASDSTLLFEGTVGDAVHFPGEWLVHVPEGTTRLKISMDDSKPLEFTIPADIEIESGMVYMMDLDIEDAIKLRTLILPSLSVGFSEPMHMSYGVMVGFCKVNGGYFRVKSDFSFGLETVGECDAEGNIDGTMGWYTGESKRSRLAFTAGYMRHLAAIGDKASLYGYLGGGYGTRTLAWQMFGSDGQNQYVRVAPSSFSGFEAEAGLAFRLGGVAVSAGVQSNSFKFYEANLGIGVMF